MNAAPKISDHAVLRFLERECGVPVEEIRALIGEVTARGADAGAPSIKVGSARFLLVDGVVVTTLGKGQRFRWKDWRAAKEQRS